MSITYTPLVTDALFNTYAGNVFDDPIAYSATNAKRIDGKFFLKPIQDEVLNLIRLALTGAGALTVRNATGVSIAAGPVRVSSYDAANSAFNIVVADADAAAPADFLLLSSLATATSGVAYISGDYVSALDTSAIAVGTEVFLSTAGVATTTAPTGADQIVQSIGFTVNQSATGTIRGYIHRPKSFGTSWLQALSVTDAKINTMAASKLTGVLPAAQMPALTGDVTNSAGSLATTIAANAVTTAKILDANVSLAKLSAAAVAGCVRRNLVINGDFKIYQRVTMPTVDNTYGPDRWRFLLGTGTPPTMTVGTDGPTGVSGSGKYVRITTAQTDSKKFGIFQPIEGANAKAALGNVCTLSFLAKVNNTSLGDIRAAIVEWSGTEDAISVDPVTAWGSSGAGITTLATNWTNVNTPSALTPTTSWARYSVSGTVGTTSKNLGVLIWCDDETSTSGDYLDLTSVQLEVGSEPTPLEYRSTGEELALCMRYFWAYAPAVASPNSLGLAMTSTSFYIPIPFLVQMRTPPSMTAATAANWTGTDGVGSALATLVLNAVSAFSAYLYGTCSGATWTPHSAFFIYQTGTEKLFFTAEL